jgi:hypothetical protein
MSTISTDLTPTKTITVAQMPNTTTTDVNSPAFHFTLEWLSGWVFTMDGIIKRLD